MPILTEFRGITYPSILWNRLSWWAWQRVCCPREWHLFDECQGIEEHILYCDACGLSVHIARFEEEDG